MSSNILQQNSNKKVDTSHTIDYFFDTQNNKLNSNENYTDFYNFCLNNSFKDKQEKEFSIVKYSLSFPSKFNLNTNDTQTRHENHHQQSHVKKAFNLLLKPIHKIQTSHELANLHLAVSISNFSFLPVKISYLIFNAICLPFWRKYGYKF